jgi:hypothetical protein
MEQKFCLNILIKAFDKKIKNNKYKSLLSWHQQSPTSNVPS